MVQSLFYLLILTLIVPIHGCQRRSDDDDDELSLENSKNVIQHPLGKETDSKNNPNKEKIEIIEKKNAESEEEDIRKNQKNTPLIKFYDQNNISDFKSLYNKSSRSDEEVLSLLKLAAKNDKSDFIEFILSKKPNIKPSSPYDSSPMDFVESNSTSYKLLKKAGFIPSLELVGLNNKSLNQAGREGNIELIKYWIRNKLSSKEQIQNMLRSVVSYSAYYNIKIHKNNELIMNKVKLIKLLIGEGADVNHLYQNGHKLLRRTIRCPKEILEEILKHKPDVNFVCKHNKTALFKMISTSTVYYDLEKVKMLVKAGANIHFEYLGKTLLDIVKYDEDPSSEASKIYNYLKSLGAKHKKPLIKRKIQNRNLQGLANIDLSKTKDYKILQYSKIAIKNNDIEMVDLLISKGVKKMDLLFTAVSENKIDIFNHLLDQGVNPINYKTKEKWHTTLLDKSKMDSEIYNKLIDLGCKHKFPLKGAAERDSLEDMKKYMSKNPNHDINKEIINDIVLKNGTIRHDDMNYSSLINTEKVEIIKYALELGLEVRKKEAISTFIEYLSKNNLLAVKVFISRGLISSGELSKIMFDFFGYDYIFETVWQKDQKELIDYLIQSGWDLKYTSQNQKYTLLHIFAGIKINREHSFLINYILDKNLIPINAKSNNGNTAMKLAKPGNYFRNELKRRGGKLS